VAGGWKIRRRLDGWTTLKRSGGASETIAGGEE
jgi:hypothetical protein